MPLSCQGLCEAEMTMPAAKRCVCVRKAIAGVVMTPALSTEAPASGEACSKSRGDPVAGLASIHPEQNAWRWVSWRQAYGRGQDQSRGRSAHRAAAGRRPPRMPSVPKSFFMSCRSPLRLVRRLKSASLRLQVCHEPGVRGSFDLVQYRSAERKSLPSAA